MSADEVAQTYAQALREIQNNQIETADFLCGVALAADPAHAGCLHLRGAIALQAGRADAAVEWIGQAIASNRRVARFHDDMGFALHAAGRTGDAIESHRRAIRLDPDNTQLYINLAVKLLALGQRDEAAENYIKAFELMPAMFDASYPDIKASLFKINPALERAAALASEAWPRRLSIEELFGAASFRAVTDDRALMFVLASAPVRDLALERLLTSIRLALLQRATQAASGEADESILTFCCALAQQCFLNEYIFDLAPEEEQAAERLSHAISAAIESKTPVPAIWVAIAGSYFSLEAIANAAALLARTWPAAIDEALTQQLREPAEERKIAGTIPRLNAIEDATSQLVRQQYEENPYPRWVLRPYPKLVPMPLGDYLKSRFPLSRLQVRSENTTDILVAGCGTGKHPMMVAKLFAGAKILAVDLSLASLSYAQRQMRQFGVANISFAQADILKLGSIRRTFDLVETAGVLHHLADPMAGLRVLLSLVGPGGFLRIGLYSELARRDVVAAREYCAQSGYPPTARGIRTARLDLMNSDLASVERFGDFFCTSECRDLLFHVQEHRFTIAQIEAVLAEYNLSFIGFELTQAVMQAYRSRFPDDSDMRRLDNWHTFEIERPETFREMYQFWVQKI